MSGQTDTPCADSPALPLTQEEKGILAQILAQVLVEALGGSTPESEQ